MIWTSIQRKRGLAALGADVMVEGETLLVLLLLGRCQHPATVPQPARKSTVSAKRTCASTAALLDHVEPRRNHMI